MFVWHSLFYSTLDVGSWLNRKHVCSKEHRDLALEAAQSGIVLLKNSAQMLPLSKTKTTTLAVIGPNANLTDMFLGNYEGPPCKNVTIIQALQGYVRNTRYEPGCVDSVNCTTIVTDEAVEIAQGADYVILVMGLDQSQEREKHDRVDLVLPGKQEIVVSAVAKVAKKPIVLIVLSGGPLDISFAKNDPKIGSILWAGYPGEAGGIALAQIIFGDHNPGGRLPMTWYPKEFINVPMTDMRMRPDPSTGYPGRTYRFYNGKTVFDFGYGLSYSNYSYESVSVTRNKIYLNESSRTTQAAKGLGSSNRHMFVSDIGTVLCEKSKISLVVGVKNHGEMAGKHSVLVFAKQGEIRNGEPIKQLVGFQSVSLGAEESGEVEFVINPCEHLSKANEDGLKIIEEGSYYLFVGQKQFAIDIVL